MRIFSLLLFLIACTTSAPKMAGVYWGAFNPPTEAHAAVMEAALNKIPLKKLIVIVNNHPYKNYAYPLQIRLQMIQEMIDAHGFKNVEVLWQDETHPLSYQILKERVGAPLCAIGGYDSYKKWVEHTSPEERTLYDAIAVVPRGDDPLLLFDQNSFILSIPDNYRHVSSSKVRALLCQ